LTLSSYDYGGYSEKKISRISALEIWQPYVDLAEMVYCSILDF